MFKLNIPKDCMLSAKGVCAEDRVDKGKKFLYRIVSILTKLINRFAPAKKIHEEVVRYDVDNTSEDD